MRIHYKPVCCLEEAGIKKRRARPLYKQILYDYSNHIIIFINAATLLILYFIGIFSYITELDFAKFNYPKEVGNLRKLVDSIDEYRLINDKENLNRGINRVNYESIDRVIEESKLHNIVPLEQFRHFNFTLDIEPTCRKQWGVEQLRATLLPITNTQPSSRNVEALDKITVIIIVKSAVNNYLRRHAIRNSWYLNQDLDIFKFKTVFIVGKCHENNRKPYSTTQYHYNISWSVTDCEENIKREATNFGDIVQSSAIDSYYNNTIKTFMTYKWVVEQCPSDFVLTIDDDYVFEVDNFINYLRKLPKLEMPEFAEPFNVTQEEIPSTQNLTFRISTTSTPSDSRDNATTVAALRKLSNQFVWSGFVRYYVRPIRVRFNKWYIKLNEYAYNKYPSFVTGGLVMMSFKTVKYFHYATFFTTSFKFDDVYAGILAYKMKIPPSHSEEFMCDLDEYLASNPIRSNVTNCVGVHDIESTKLFELWDKRNETARQDLAQDFHYKS